MKYFQQNLEDSEHYYSIYLKKINRYVIILITLLVPNIPLSTASLKFAIWILDWLNH